jgi:hypothetical protein
MPEELSPKTKGTSAAIPDPIKKTMQSPRDLKREGIAT